MKFRKKIKKIKNKTDYYLKKFFQKIENFSQFKSYVNILPQSSIFNDISEKNKIQNSKEYKIIF